MIKAGFSRVDVTPPLGSYLAGHYQKRYADGILEPIELNAIAISDGKNTAVVIVSDLQGLRRAWADPIRNMVAEKVGLPTTSISVTALHQHTSSALRPGEKNNVIKDNAYLDFLYRKFCDVAEMAIADMEEAEMSVGAMETSEPIAFIRRYMMKNGKVITNPYDAIEDIVMPSEKQDDTVRLIRFKRENKKDIAFVNFQTHPDVVGGNKYSWDWCGYVRLFVEKDNPDTHCILMNGFEGDSNHINYMGEQKRGHEHCIHMGRVIANAVRDMWNETEKKDVDTVLSKVSVVYNKTRSDGVEYFDECQKLLSEHPGESELKTKSGISYTEAVRIVTAVKSAPLFQKIPVTVIELGDVAIVGLAGEAFVNYGKNVRELYPNKFILTSCSMNGHEGYLPTTKAFEQGGYEVTASPFSSTIEKDCLKEIDKLFKS